MKSSTQTLNYLVEGEAANKPKSIGASSKTHFRVYIAALLFSDLLMMILAFNLAYFIRFRPSLNILQIILPPTAATYSYLGLALAPAWLAIFAIAGLYQRKNLLGGTQEYSRVFRSSSVGLFLVMIGTFLMPTFVVARAWLILFWWLSFLLTAVARFSLRRVVYSFRRRGYFLSPTLIIGANDEGFSLARQLLSWPTSGLEVLGFVDKKFSPGTKLFGNLCVLGSIEELDEVIQRNGVEEVILASSAFSTRDHLLEIFKHYGQSGHVNLRMSSGLYEIITTGLTVKEFAYVPLVGVNKVRLTGVDQVLKLILDYGLTIPGLVIISPVLLLIAIGIKLDSPGPILHRRRVMGVNARQFEAYKFRTMYINGDEILSKFPKLEAELEQKHKLKDDPRITRLGRILRKFSLDELPQLFNVFKLDMSLVGPRMISPKEMDEYNKWGINLLTVRPGITGLWQVSGRSDVSYEERVRLDMHYIRNWNIWLDFQLIVRTIPAILWGKGAY